jgi:hypothetical protein
MIPMIGKGILLTVGGLLLASSLPNPAGAGGPPKPPTPDAFKPGTSVRVGSVLVPDGGTAVVAGVSTVAEGRNQAGVPGAAKAPYFGKAFGNVGSGKSASKVGVSIGVRIIDLRAMDEQLLGGRP